MANQISQASIIDRWGKMVTHLIKYSVFQHKKEDSYYKTVALHLSPNTNKGILAIQVTKSMQVTYQSKITNQMVNSLHKSQSFNSEIALGRSRFTREPAFSTII